LELGNSLPGKTLSAIKKRAVTIKVRRVGMARFIIWMKDRDTM
jgi:hypothetical protein